MDDNQVRQLLQERPHTTTELRHRLGVGVEASKALELALQRLRRRGEVLYQDRRWRLSGTYVCPKCSGVGWVKNDD